MIRLSSSILTSLFVAALLSACTTMQGDVPSLKTISVAGAPKAIGPYAQGVIANGMLYASGQLARDPVSNNMIDGDVKAQTNRIFDNLQAVLVGAGCTFKDVVKVTVYMTDLNDFAKMNEAYTARFGDARPARSTIQAAKLPGGANIEIDMIVRVP